MSENSIHHEQAPVEQQQPSNAIIENKIHVSDPRKETEQQSTFISYLVHSNVSKTYYCFLFIHTYTHTHIHTTIL